MLREFRESIGLSAQDAADAVGIHKATYCRIETGHVWPSRDVAVNLMRFVRAFGGDLTFDQVLLPAGPGVEPYLTDLTAPTKS